VNKISGSLISQRILTRLKSRPIPSQKLSAILVGDDPASLSFLHQKQKAAEEIGINFDLLTLPNEISESVLKFKIHNLTQDSAVGGIIIQLPLPPHLPTQEILDQIPVQKDIDILSSAATQRFAVGESSILPPAVGTVQEILDNQNFDLSEKTVAVVGLGRLVGRPIATWLKNKTERLITIDLGDDIDQIKEADLVISGTGRPRLIDPAELKPGVAVIDFGYGKANDQVQGDLDISQLSTLRSPLNFYTPTPGGTGPILVAKLLENFFILNQN